MLAITHLPSPRMRECRRTFVEEAEIDLELALRQHAAYRQKLADLGVEVSTLRVNRQQPDCAFIEDLAIVLDEVAVLAAMGTAARAVEPEGIETALRGMSDLVRIAPPATIEGGDVLRVGRTLLVGLSTRTNRAGVTALEEIGRLYGYRVRAVPVTGCLHLKTACTALPDERLLVNPDWLDRRALGGFRQLTVPPAEPWAANTLSLGEQVLMQADHVQTAEMLRRLGMRVETVDISEFAKAEGGVTCLSLLVK